MSDEVTFIDTNVLVYGYDADAGTKHEKARTLLAGLWNEQAGVLSTQVLQPVRLMVLGLTPAGRSSEVSTKNHR